MLNLHAFLESHHITLAHVLTQAQATLCLGDDDVLVVCGSLVEALGNAKSDLDCYLITRRTNFVYTSVDCVLIPIGTCLCDVRVIGWDIFEQVIERFARWSALPRRPRSATLLSDADRRLIHRVMSGLPLYGRAALQRFGTVIQPEEVARHKLDWARYHANTLQVDLAGMRDAGDWASMIFVAQDLAAHSADALLAASGQLNPNPKWRARLLERLDASWDAVLPGVPTGQTALQRYLLSQRGPATTHPSTVLDYCLQAVAFSRTVLGWAERRVLTGEDFPVRVRAPSNACDQCILPALDLDVAAWYVEDRFQLLRLNAAEQPFLLSSAAYDVIVLFDGVTSVDTARRHAQARYGPEGQPLLERLMALVRFAGFAVEPPYDERVLRALLREASASSRD